MHSLKLLDATDLLEAVAVVVATIGRWPFLVMRPVWSGAEPVATVHPSHAV